MSGLDPEPDEEPEYVTREELKRVVRFFKKEILDLNERIGDAFQAISDSENAEVQLVDEAVEKAERAQRLANRLKKRLDTLEASLVEED